MSNYQEVFLQEANELLYELESQLLELEQNPDDLDLVGRIFRALHTIKGSGAMFGFDNVSQFTHDLENIFDLIRNEKLKVSHDLIDLTLRSRDYMQRLLDDNDVITVALNIEGLKLTESIQALLPKNDKDDTEPSAKSDETMQLETTNADEPKVYFISFKPYPDLFKIGINPVLLLDELREMGEYYIKSNMERLPDLEEIDPESCYTEWNILLKTTNDKMIIQDVFIFVEDVAEISVVELGAHPALTQNVLQKMIDQIPFKTNLEKYDLMQIADSLTESKKKQTSTGGGVDTLVQSGKGPEATIRVASDRLDTLVDLVGEFVTMQAHLAQHSKKSRDSETQLMSEQMERLTSELRDNVMSLRMQPIGTIFGKFRRLVRDLSSDLNKEVKLITEGEQTELDKSVIEKLNDPLMHIIRNSIDHGIELPAERLNKDKSEEGTVRLVASHSGANVVIKIIDDGKGLDKNAIYEKALERSLVTKESSLSDNEIYQFIFHPGFSTNTVVTNVSGRGVGMDVVKKAIDALGGTIEIKSEAGKGTEISLILPLTLAIIEGLLVSLGDDYFILPLSIVDECVELIKSKDTIEGRHLIDVRGHMVPYLRLREYFGMEKSTSGIEQVVIAEINSNKFGFVVDNVIGGHQTVIKSLGKLYKNIEGISGATILGDGSVALILDLIKLEQAALQLYEENTTIVEYATY